MMDQLFIRVFRPVDEPALAALYVLEHERVLADIGVSTAIANSNPWLNDPNAHLIVAMHDSLGMVAGIRVQPAAAGVQLPMEHCISELDKGIHDILRFLEKGGTAEVCGLWNAHRYAGKGVPLLLSQAAVALATQLNLRSMTCFVAHYTLRHARKVGFIPMEGVGNNGVFTYPIPSIRSIAMVIPDTYTLNHATPATRQAILSLRARPMQSRVENPAGNDIRVNYLLHPRTMNQDLTVYGEILENRRHHSV